MREMVCQSMRQFAGCYCGILKHFFLIFFGFVAEKNENLQFGMLQLQNVFTINHAESNL